jgi:hypothetical protein
MRRSSADEYVRPDGNRSDYGGLSTFVHLTGTQRFQEVSKGALRRLALPETAPNRAPNELQGPPSMPVTGTGDPQNIVQV